MLHLLVSALPETTKRYTLHHRFQYHEEPSFPLGGVEVVPPVTTRSHSTTIMVTTKNKEKRQHGCLAYAVSGMLYSVLANRRQLLKAGGGEVFDRTQRREKCACMCLGKDVVKRCEGAFISDGIESIWLTFTAFHADSQCFSIEKGA